MENQYGILLGYPQTTSGANGLITQAWVLGDPNVTVQALNVVAPGCRLLQQDASTGYALVVWNNDAALGATPSWSEVSRTDSAGAVTSTTSLSSADILALNDTPIEIIPAPGAGKVIQVLSVTGALTFDSAAYATHTELDIIDTTSGDVLFEDTGTLLAATGDIVAQVEANGNSHVALEVTENGSVSATVATGNPATGDGTLKIYATYKIITL